MILAPHPDEEALGCGGLISHLCSTGNYSHVVIMTERGSLRNHSDISKDIVVTERRKLTLKSTKALGLSEKNVHLLAFYKRYSPSLRQLRLFIH